MTSTTAIQTAPPVILRYDSPIGALTVWTHHESVTRLDVECSAGPPQTATMGDASTPFHDEIRRQLDDYFSGRQTTFSLATDQPGTAFQTEVWQALAEVAWGTATSYGELADRTGRPLGARAVGGAIRANRIALLVPCHRVLGAARSLTGYSPGDGIATKKWLLRHEGIDFNG